MQTPARRLPFGANKSDISANGQQRLSMGRRLAIQTTRGSADGQQHFDLATLRASVSGADVRLQRKSDGVVFTGGQSRTSSSLLVEVSNTHLHWQENDVLDLEGDLVGSGLHWYLPGRDIGMYYTSEIFEVSGSIYGERVRGFVPFDPVYMADGAVLYADKDVLEGERLCLAWYTWGRAGTTAR